MAKQLGEYWVTFDVLETEAKALEDATGVGAHDRVGGVVTQEPSDGTAMVVFEVVALDQDGAWREAEEAYEALREDARLENVPPLGGSVTRIREAPSEVVARAEAPRPSTVSIAAPPQPHEGLLDKARALFEKDEYEYATVAAQTACEVAIGQSMRRLMPANPAGLRKALEGFVNKQFSLSQERVADLWSALAGEEIRQADFWSRYREHVVRRNGVMHEGSSVTRSEAEESLRVATEVCDYVIRLSR
jgi:HEPN domain-containing protein